MTDTPAAKDDKAASKDETAKKGSVRKVKYMGASNWRRIEKGDTFGGRLPSGLPATLHWDEDAAHVLDVDVDALGGPEVLDLLLGEEGPEGKEFKDVSEHKVVPDSLFQKRWRPRGSGGPGETPNMVRSTGSAASSSSASLSGTGGSTTPST